MTTIKPCPFCAKTPAIVQCDGGGISIICECGKSLGPCRVFENNTEAAIEFWNSSYGSAIRSHALAAMLLKLPDKVVNGSSVGQGSNEQGDNLLSDVKEESDTIDLHF